MRFLSIILACLSILITSERPLSKPRNYPDHGPATQSRDENTSPGTKTPPEFGYEERPPVSPVFKDTKMLGYKSTFPVINVRYTFPPTMVDARRRLAMAQRQKEILDDFEILESRLIKDAKEMLKHIGIQSVIAKRLEGNLLNSGLMDDLASTIPEVPASSFIQQPWFTNSQTNPPDNDVPDQPQINISVEDNTLNVMSPDSMSPNNALRMMREIQNSISTNRGIVVLILEQNFKIFQLLLKWMRRNKSPKSGSLLQIGTTPTTIGPTIPPGWYSENVTNNASVPTSPRVRPIGIDFPFFIALRSRVMEGGREGAKALATLIDLWNDNGGARDLIRRTMVLADCKLLMMSSKTPDYIKNLAGTLSTLITGIPSGSSVPDATSGSYGHVNVIVPRPSRVYLADKEIALDS
jgi:hypothetical protein